MALNGSSSSINLLLLYRHLAICNLFCSPPDRLLLLCDNTSFSLTSAKQAISNSFFTFSFEKLTLYLTVSLKISTLFVP